LTRLISHFTSKKGCFMHLFIKLKCFFRDIEIQNSTNMTSQTKTPFCKVCFDAKKSKDEYTSHWVKSKPGPDGVVVCPYLLTLECRYCKGKGHTPRGCPVLKKRKAINYIRKPELEFNICEDNITFRQPKCHVHQCSGTAPRRGRVNGFDGLSQYSDSEDGSRQGADVAIHAEPLKWVDIAAKPPVLKRSTADRLVTSILTEELDTMDLPALAPDDDEFLRRSATGQKMSWADFCDSD